MNSVNRISKQGQKNSSISDETGSNVKKSGSNKTVSKQPREQQSSNSSSNSSDPYNSTGTFEVGKYKTKLCRHWKSGYCLFGPSCVFAHGVDDLCEPNLLMSQMNNLVLVPMPAYYPPVYSEGSQNNNNNGSNFGPIGSGLQTGSQVQVPMPMSVPLMPYLPQSSQLLPIGMPSGSNIGRVDSTPNHLMPLFPTLSASAFPYFGQQQPQQQQTQETSNSKTDSPSKADVSKPNLKKCPICLDAVQPLQQKSLLPCMHEFHSDCFKSSESKILKYGCPECTTKKLHENKSDSAPTVSKPQKSQFQPIEITAE